MTKEERQKYKELTKVLPKILKDKIKKYKFKKKDFMIWYKKKELFFDLLIDVKVKSDDKCYCTAVETIKPLWFVMGFIENGNQQRNTFKFENYWCIYS